MGHRTEDHLSRPRMPDSWNIKKKGIKYVSRPNPGAHSFKFGMSLMVMFRDILKISRTAREANRLFQNQEVLVDGKRRKDPRYMVGFMDVISLPKVKKSYRVLLNRKGKLDVVEIDEKEAALKPCKIRGKSQKNNKIQLNTIDGKNILMDKTDNRPGDTVMMELPSQKIKESFKMEKGNSVFLIGGKHVGDTGIIEEVKDEKITYKRDKEVLETARKYAFVIGKEKPAITMLK